MNKTEIKALVKSEIEKAFKKDAITEDEVVEIVQKIMVNFYKFLWFRKDQWQQQIKKGV